MAQTVADVTEDESTTSSDTQVSEHRPNILYTNQTPTDRIVLGMVLLIVNLPIMLLLFF